MKCLEKRIRAAVLAVVITFSLVPISTASAMSDDTEADYSAAAAVSAEGAIDLADAAPAASGSGWTFSENVYTVLDGAEVTVTGNNSSSGRRVEVAPGATAQITLSGAAISGVGSRRSALALNPGASLTLILSGGSYPGNRLTGGEYGAGVNAPRGTSLTIRGAGTLYATGGIVAAGIGGAGHSGGADVTSAGDILIESGVINATGGNIGAGIGGCAHADYDGAITITGGQVTAQGGAGGAGIGGAGTGRNDGVITITAGIVSAAGGNGAAGIGGGGEVGVYFSGGGGRINISGMCDVTGSGSGGGAGIGGGVGGHGGAITISGWRAVGRGSRGGAGIGGGTSASSGEITINGGTYIEGYAYAGSGIYEYDCGAGIGAGGCEYKDGEGVGGGKVDSIVINGGARVEAYSQVGAAIGSGSVSTYGRGQDGPITINGGNIHALSQDGAGIGGGYNGSSGYVTITGGVVEALSSQYSAGIGSGPFGLVTQPIYITGGKVTARGGYFGAGIGGGYASDGGDVTVSGGVVEATSGDVSSDYDRGSGIGKGSDGESEGRLYVEGNAIVLTDKAGDTSPKTKGILFDTARSDTAFFYGNYVTMEQDLTLGSPLQLQGLGSDAIRLEVPEGSTFRIPEGRTLALLEPGMAVPLNGSAIIVEGEVATNKIGGAGASQPIIAAMDATGITVEASLLADTGQSLEYGIRLASAPSVESWQAEGIFTGLQTGAEYVITARSVENAWFTSSLGEGVFFVAGGSGGGVAVRGRVSTYNPGRPTILRLLQNGAEKYSAAIAPAAGSGAVEQDFAFLGVAPGIYTLVAKKDAHADVTVARITVGGSDLDLGQDPREMVRALALPCGDINRDGVINSADLAVLWRQGNYNRAVSAAEQPLCDLDGDEVVNSNDLAVLWQTGNYNRGAVLID